MSNEVKEVEREYEQPLVSVVVPCYNHEGYVKECIQSIIDQDYQNIELLVIDDGSKDGSVKKIVEMIPACQHRFRRFEFRNRPNKGLCATLNEALIWCKGKYFAPSASDDVLKISKISSQVKVLIDNENLAGVFVGIEIVDESGAVIKHRGGDSNFGFREVFLRKAFMPGQAVMLVRKHLIKIGGYNPHVAVEDFYLFLKLSSMGLFFSSVKTPLVVYRRHGDNLSSKLEIMWDSISKILYDYRSHPLYSHALSCSMLIHAHDMQASCKRESWKWAAKAVKNYPLCVVSKSFVWLMLKMFK